MAVMDTGRGSARNRYPIATLDEAGFDDCPDDAEEEFSPTDQSARQDDREVSSGRVRLP